MDYKRRIVAEFSARNKAKGELASFRKDIKRTGDSVKRMAGNIAGMVGMASMGMALKSVIAAALVQETAVADLTAAMRNNADQSAVTVSALEKYAAEMQRSTIYGDELILSQMAYAKNLGVTTDNLKAAAKAAIGLAAKYRIDLQSAMMLIGRASQGQTQMLTRYGIVLDESLTAQEKFNAILRIGADSFNLAEAAAKTGEGQLIQFKNSVGDLKEEVGKGLLPALLNLVKGLNAVGRAGKTVAKAIVPVEPDSPWTRWKALPQKKQDDAMEEYRRYLQQAAQARMKRGQTANKNDWRENPDILDEIISAYGLSDKIQGRVNQTITPVSVQYEKQQREAYDRHMKTFRQGEIKRSEDAYIAELAINAKRIESDKNVISSARKRMISLTDQVDTEIELLGKLDEPRQHARQLVEFQAAAAATYTDNAEAAAAATERFRQKLDELGKAERLQRIADGIGDSFGRAFEDMALGAANASDAIRSLARDVARLMMRQMITEPLKLGISNVVKDLFSAGSTGELAAIGGGSDFVNSPGIIEAPASAMGNVFNRPTLGVFGEAGPEAVMPLTRGPGGKLGVSAGRAGGDQGWNVIVNNFGPPIDVEAEQRNTRELILSVYAENVNNGGMLRGLG